MGDSGVEHKKILVVDDEKPLAKALDLKLTHEGFEAKVAFDGEEALALLEQEKFDLIILDIMMPKVDGFGVMAELKKRGIMTPVIVSSNLSQGEDVEKLKSAGAIDYYIKSDVPIAEVVERVKKVLSIQI
jgi:DNA-binding response OmpR family regulator